MKNLTEFVGEECLPITLFREPNVIALKAWLDEQWEFQERVIDRLKSSTQNHFEQTKNQIAGIVNVCLAELETDEKEKKRRLEKAAAQFKVAFPKIQEHFQIHSEVEYRKDSRLKGSHSIDAFSVVVDDFRRRLLAPHNSQVKPPTGSVVQTPVFIAHGYTASVFLLSVELINDGIAGIFPDIYSMGAMALKEDFQESVQRIWSLADMGNTRAIWKITKFSRYGNKDLTPERITISSLEGRSMEAAFLSALWALRGGIPKDEVFQFKGSLLMELLVGVTGMVRDDLPQKDDKLPGSYFIQRVQSTGHKLRVARKNELDTVVIASRVGDTTVAEQRSVKTSTDEFGMEKRQLEDDRTDQQQKAKATDYGGLTVLELETARDVFDSLLVTNRWLKAWQDGVRQDWLCQWEGGDNPGQGSARAVGDHGKGPDDDNRPTNAAD